MKRYSVLKNEAIDGLQIKEDGIYVDATLGYAGDASEILKRIKRGKLFAFDRDEEALKYSDEVLQKLGNSYTLIHSDFVHMKEKLQELEIDKVDGILVDLGVSSYQIDTAARGFSFMKNARLDMRMNKNQSLDAYKVINAYSEQDLARIMFEYGEERNARQIARKIVKIREKKPIETTFEFRDIIVSSYPPKFQNKPSLCNKAFQAIRIEVNGELDDLKTAVESMINALSCGGRLCIISFHPLEDRIVKNAFKMHSTNCICPPKIPKCVCGHVADVKLITKHPIVPTDNELLSNTRSASSKLRIIEKI